MPKARDPLDDSIQDLTDNVVAIRHFTDREDAIEAFQTCVDADEGETLPVVSYYGVGGAGKSVLLRKLAGVLGESYKDMPFARVDFVAQANRDRVMALCSLRQQLGEFGLDFEGFDLVRAVMAWQQGASEEHLLAVSPWLKGALGMVKAVFAATQPLVAGAAAVAGAGAKPVADRVPQKTLDRVKAALGGTQALLDMRGLDPQTIFDRHLVPQFAAGLCEGLQKRKKGHRGVLFIDSYELLWSGSDTPRSPRGRDLDEWVRRLCSYLLHYRNVLLVIAGRDELAWPEIDPEWANATDDDIAGHAVGGLSRHDAASFLAKCEVGSPPDVGKAEPLQTAIVDCAEADPEVEGCHPFLLALCANIVQQERSGGGSDPAPSVFQDIPAGEAVERLAALFLKSLHSEETADLVQALSVPRWFDLELVTARRDAGEDTGRTLLTQLARFSFTQFGESGELRMHSVMRRALRLRLQQATPEHHVSVHEWCRDHWEGRIEADGGSAGREWWHHVSLTDPLGEKWNEVEQVLAEHSDQLGWEDAMTLPPTWLGCNVERLVRALMDGGLFVLAGRCVQHGTDIGDELEEELVSALFGEFGDSWRTWSIDVLVEMGSIRVMEAAMCMLGQGEPAPLFLADLV
ncbi:MAG TPA: hypothetical protein QGH10_07245, partial [Armatimonadota bacterium]|nr:hypothetical protein [Armatimonadota bacterium]